MKKYYSDITNDPNFPKIEEQVLDFWKKNDIFQKTIHQRPKDKEFVFYDGPPFANGLPHYGHLLTGFIKDTFARYKTMQGFRVERRFGWDCHGLPVEMLAEKELQISGKAAIEKFGIDKFNEYCRNSVMKFSKEWKQYVTRQARWVDFDNDYKTMDKPFMESVLWVFKELYKKGLIYESVRVVPYSWACQTPLSNFETKLDNAYREKKSKSVVVAFELEERSRQVFKLNQKCKILVWTTTPWTLPCNLALAIGKNIDYCGIIVNDTLYIFSSGYLKTFEHYCQSNNLAYSLYNYHIDNEVLSTLHYKPLFDYLVHTQDFFKIFCADFVTESDGTGIVHIAPGFGEDDFLECQKQQIPNKIGKDVSKILATICPIDDSGRFTEIINDFKGIHVFDTNDAIIKKLKEKKSWISTDQYIHNYPHCWRTDTPLIYRAMSSWYVKVTSLKKQLIDLNRTVNWIPAHIREGQFGKWLEGARDWSISRNRFWGTPLPIWKSNDSRYPRIDIYGSIAELEKDFNTKIDDLHRPHIDKLTRKNPDDPTGQSTMHRVNDVFDCWFESGSMPYAQSHYPFENSEWFSKNFPADFITEYIAQTRGWFYTLFVLSAALFNKAPFSNCICHGVVLDVKGQKLSKRLNNYANPIEVFNKYGADALRILMLSSAVTCGGDLLLDKDALMVRDILKTVINPLWNSFYFFTLYANSDRIEGEIIDDFSIIDNAMDRYIISECKLTLIKINNYMGDIHSSREQYDAKSSCQEIISFLDKLNNWYIRRCRQRFWSSIKNQDKINAYNTLYTVLYYLTRASAPLLPLISEAIWQELSFKKEESVHLSLFPKFEELCHNRNSKEILPKKEALNRKIMLNIISICNGALSLRNLHNIRVRQPLTKLTIYVRSPNHLLNIAQEYKDILKDEVNVKEILVINDMENIAFFKLKLNFPLLGERIPEKIKSIIEISKLGKWQELEDGKLLLGKQSENHHILEPEEYEINLVTKDEFSCVVNCDELMTVITLDTVLTHELLLEGLSRDIVRSIQRLRKDLNFKITDQIDIIWQSSDALLTESINLWQDYIKRNTLTRSIIYMPDLQENTKSYTKINIEKKGIIILLRKINDI